MQRVVLRDVDLDSVVAAVGAGSYARGAQYVRQRAVVQMSWEAAESTLRGTVRGSAGDLYTTEVYFSSGDEFPLEFVHGQCSCPVGFNCKHAAALILTAASPVTTAASPVTTTAQAAPDGTATAPSATARAGSPQAPRFAAWERSLESLLEPRSAASAGRPGETPLAIELTLSQDARPVHARGRGAGGPPLKIAARLVQPGKNGGWIGSSLSWAKLDSLHYYGGYSAAHLKLLQEMYAVYRACGSHRAYYYSYGDEKSIDLSAFESRQLWPLLDEAQAAGLRLVHRGKLGPVESYRSAELCLDVTCGELSGAPGALVITPLIRVDGADADLVLAAPAGQARQGRPGAAAADGAGGGAAGGSRCRAGPVPRRVLPAAAAGGHGDLVG